MKLIKAGTSKLDASGLIAKAAHVEGAMEDNENFATPNPSLGEVKTAREALVVAVANAVGRAPADIAIRNAQSAVLRTLLVNLARYVNNVAQGDVDKAVSSGFGLADSPEPSTHLAPPNRLEARMSNFEGSVDLLWKRVAHARMYNVYLNAGDPNDSTNWQMVTVSSRAQIRVAGLIPGKQYAFRVTALGRIGEGPASDIVSGRAA